MNVGSESQEPGRRRRRSSSRDSGRVAFRLTPSLVAKGINWVGLVAGLLFLVLSFKSFNDGYVYYGKFLLGQTKDETIYGFNLPNQVAQDVGQPWATAPKDRDALNQYDLWRYSLSSGALVVLNFGQDGRAQRIVCRGGGVLRACPSSFGVELGQDEEEVVRNLGRPSREIYQGTAKTLIYPEMGLSVHLEQFVVTQLTIDKSRDGLGWISRYLRWALP